MPAEKSRVDKIYIMLQSNGNIVLDKDYLWDGCDTPELPASIEMPPVTLRKLVELVSRRNLDWPDPSQTEALKTLRDELKTSTKIIEDTIMKIEAKT